MANINKLGARALDTPVREHHTDRASEHRQRVHQQEMTDFLYALSCMQEMRRYAFARDTIEGIYETVAEKGYVTDGQRRAINNIREGCGEGAI
jgi:hypothetical protein